jgi:hypothetical protein
MYSFVRMDPSVLFGEGRTISEAANTDASVGGSNYEADNEFDEYTSEDSNVPDWFNSDDDDDATGDDKPRYQRHANVDT